jgi:hypothetical protein
MGLKAQKVLLSINFDVQHMSAKREQCSKVLNSLI